MHLLSLFHLSHREFVAFRTRSLATVITIGLLFGLLLGITIILQGLENVVMCHAGEPTNRLVYFASDYNDGHRPELVLERISYYGGRVVEVSPEDTTHLDFSPQYIAVFDNYPSAYAYYSKLDSHAFNYSPQQYYVSELYTNQIRAYSYFRHLNNAIYPILIILLITAILILTFTTAHLIAQNTISISLYRSLGASRPQIFSIYLAYLLELCFYAMLFTIIIALIIASIATFCGWSHLQTTLATTYPDTSTYWPVLVGFNWQCMLIIGSIFTAAPFAFILCIDQFSTKKLAQRLKGD